jgi:hypothetical protein
MWHNSRRLPQDAQNGQKSDFFSIVLGIFN